LLLSLVAVVYSSSLAGWLRTPVGLAHPSCIHRVPSGSSINSESGRTIVTKPDGSLLQIPKCDHQPVFPQSNSSQDFAAGWQAWTTYQSSNPAGLSSFLGYFTIPNNPLEVDGQTLFMFTGLQNYNWIPGPNSPPAPSLFEIIQPVLQWGPSAGGGGNYWTLASWYVTIDAGFLISDLIPVNAGDSIYGNMTLIAPNSWYIGGTVVSSGTTVSLVATKNRLKVNQWAYCTLEVYNDGSTCGEYPTNPQLYSKLKLFEAKQVVTPTWQVNVTPDPICGEHATVESPSDVTIHFGNSVKRLT